MFRKKSTECVVLYECGRGNIHTEVNLRCNFIQANVAYFANLNVSDVCGCEKKTTNK